MARISTYPIVSIPTLNDLLIGTDVENLNETKNFSLGDISGLISQGFVPYVGATGNVNLGSFNITAASFIIPGGLATQFVKADGSLDSTAYTPQTRTLTINGVTYNLSANRSWDLNTVDTLTTTGTSGAATYVGKTLNIPVYQAQGAYITQLSGEATAVGPGNATVTLDNAAVIGKILSGLNVTGGTVVSTDTILQAFGKVQNQINALAGGVEYQGVWNAATNNPFLQSSVGVQGHYYVVNVAGNTNLNGITDWQIGDWAIFNGSTWDKVDNTDAVVSVNGYVGAVVLTASDVGAVPTTRTLTINGVGYNLSADRSWTVGDVRTDQTYANPSWITSLAWTKITGTPTTLAGYGITDGALNTTTLTINGVTFDLTANRTWNVGTVTSIATTGPITGGTITGSGTIGITQAGASSDGYLSSTDWNTFNGKQGAISVTAPLTFVAGVVGITQSGASSNGYLSSTDWNTFNNKVSGSGTPNTLPMWGSSTSLINSPLSYAADTFNFQYNSATGGTVVFTNSNGTAYAYTIQMNNFGSPRSTIHSYTDGLVIQSIGGTQVSRIFANGNMILGVGTVDNGYKLEITGNLYVNSIVNATTDTDTFLVSDGGVIKYITGTQLLSYIGAQGALTLTTTGTSGPATLISNTLNIPDYSSAITGYVPYTGATQNVNLGEFGLSGGYFQADLSPTQAGGVGRLIWNNTDGTLNLGLLGGNISLHIGQQQYARVVNGTGGNVLRANYQVVKIIGAQGQRLQIGFSRADNDFNSKDSLGLIAENINSNNEGFITTSGLVEEINTTGSLQGETWVDGDTLYLSGTTFGRLTNIKPAAPIHTVIIGFVVYAHANHGKIFVKVDNGYELEELHDVAPTPYINNGVLYRDTTTNLWKSATIPTVLGYTPANAATTITINGTTYDLSANRSWSVGTVNTLTTTGTSGPATLVGSTLNIPNYTTDLSGYVPYTGATQSVDLGTYSLSSNNLISNGGVNSGALLLKQTGSSSNIYLGYTTITPSSAYLLRFGFSTSSGVWKSFRLNVFSLTDNTERTYTMPNADGVLALTSDLAAYVTLATDQTITGFKTILRGGDVLNFKIGTDTLYGLKVAYNQNELVPSGEATWSFVNTFNRNGTGYETTPISFFRGVLVTGQRLLSASVNTNLLDYYGNNPSGRYPIYAYNTGVQQFASSIIVGETAGVVNPATGAIADLPAGVVANFKGRVIGSNAVNSNEFATLGQVTSTSRAAISLTTTGTSGPATYSSVTGVLNIPEYQGGVTSFNTRTGAVTLTSSDVTTALGYTPVTDARTLTINGVTYDLTANRTWTVGVNPSAREIQTYVATSGQTTFTVTGGYTVGLVDVFINGVRLTSSDYTATNGTTVVLTVGTMVGNIVDIIKYTSGLVNSISGTGTTNELAYFTASTTIASLSTATYPSLTELSYVKGVTSSIQTQLNAKQAAGTYVTSVTASSPLFSSGSTTPNITIQQASGSQSGFLSSTDWTTFNSKQNALTNPVTGTGVSGQVAYFTGTTAISSESNLFWDATNDRLGIGINVPARKLDIRVTPVSTADDGIYINDGVGDFLLVRTGSAYTYRGVPASASMVYSNTTLAFLSDNPSGRISFHNNSGEYARFTSVGRFLLGDVSTDNGARLQVSGTATVSSSVTALNGILSGTGSAFADGLRINRNSNTNQYTVINHLGGATNIVSVDQSGNNIAEIYFGRSINGSTISNSMMIDKSGNVGIGTVSPSSFNSAANDLVVGTISGNNGITIAAATNGFSSIYFADGTTGNEAFRGYLEYGHSADYLGIGTAASERMRITSGGNVLIGTTTDNGNRLNVSGSIYASSSISSGTSINASTYVSAPFGFYTVNESRTIPFVTWTTLTNVDSNTMGMYLVVIGLTGGGLGDWAATGILYSNGITASWINGPTNGSLVQIRISGTAIQVYQNGTSPSIGLSYKLLKVA